MRSKNIIFKKYGIVLKNKKKIKNLINYYSQLKLFKSFSNKYNYSFSKSKIQKYKKFDNYTIVGIGGSSLGIEAIYKFLNFKSKKNFIFKNNLSTQKIKENKKTKNLNIIISKSGNTLETITNFNNLKNKKIIFFCVKIPIIT